MCLQEDIGPRKSPGVLGLSSPGRVSARLEPRGDEAGFSAGEQLAGRCVCSRSTAEAGVHELLLLNARVPSTSSSFAFPLMCTKSGERC